MQYFLIYFNMLFVPDSKAEFSVGIISHDFIMHTEIILIKLELIKIKY